MSISLYYSASRSTLSPAEQKSIDELIARANADFKSRWSGAAQWESFVVYAGTDEVFAGATKLPDDDDEVLWAVLRHWVELVSRIRRVLPDASWHVHVDDHDLVWDPKSGAYDPMQ